jgi:molybdopterin molybdotransferase
MITVAEADKLLASLLPEPETEVVPLAEAAGRLLAEPLKADRDGPPYDRVAMDGYAVSSTPALRSWKIVGFQAAGHPPLPPGEVGTAVEIATGAILPDGRDTVIPYERTVREGEWVTLNDGMPLMLPMAHVHRQGSDYKEGDVLLTLGSRLTSPRLHSLASVGCDPVAVIRRAVWSIAATGDELVAIKTKTKPKPWQIRRSNTAAIAGEAFSWGLTPTGQTVLPDDRDELRQGIDKLLAASPDVLVLTGGVSAGALDLVPAVLADLGAETVFHHIAQRPGKPLWCGRVSREGRQTVIFGLPGNPVSSLFAFRRYVLPWLLAFEGCPSAGSKPSHPVGSAESLGGKPGQTVFVPWSEAKGVLEWKGSGDFAALSESTGFVEVSEGAEPKYFPWGGIR